MRNFGSSGIRTQFLATLDKRLRPPGPTCWGDHNILCILFPLMPPCWKSTSLFLFCYFLTIFCSDWEYRYLEQSSRSPLKQGKKVCRIAGFWGSHQKFFKVPVLSQKLLSKTNKVFRAYNFHTKDRLKVCDHSSRANLSPQQQQEEWATLLSCNWLFMQKPVKLNN